MEHITWCLKAPKLSAGARMRGAVVTQNYDKAQSYLLEVIRLNVSRYISLGPGLN